MSLSNKTMPRCWRKCTRPSRKRAGNWHTRQRMANRLTVLLSAVKLDGAGKETSDTSDGHCHGGSGLPFLWQFGSWGE
jgi:hypothetical protein